MDHFPFPYESSSGAESEDQTSNDGSYAPSTFIFDSLTFDDLLESDIEGYTTEVNDNSAVDVGEQQYKMVLDSSLFSHLSAPTTENIMFIKQFEFAELENPSDANHLTDFSNLHSIDENGKEEYKETSEDDFERSIFHSYDVYTSKNNASDMMESKIEQFRVAKQTTNRSSRSEQRPRFNCKAVYKSIIELACLEYADKLGIFKQSD